MKYKCRVFQKDVPDDQETLMTRIINSMDSYNKEKDTNNVKKAASELMVMMSEKRGEASNAEEELVCNQIYNDNNCETLAKQTKNNIEHDRICLVETNL